MEREEGPTSSLIALLSWSHGVSEQASQQNTLTLPYNSPGVEEFTEKYKDSCVGWGAHDVDQGSIWYYFRPAHYSCELEEEDIIKAEASVSMSQS